MRRSTNDFSGEKLVWVAAATGLFLAGSVLYRELNKFDLRGKSVLITGGSRGLGLELARLLGKKGAKISICSRTKEQLDKAHQSLAASGIDVFSRTANLTEKLEVDSLIADVIQHRGRIDVLINNAGIIQVGPETNMNIADYEKAMDINFWAALYGMHAVLPHFLKQGSGRIVNVTSIGGKIAVPHLLPYSASKFALVGLSEGMHAELKKHNILVTTVVPNLMRTGSPRNAIIKGNHEKEYEWFRVADSTSLLSQDVTRAARSIVSALEYGESETILSLTGKLATLAKGIAPSWVNLALSFADRFLPRTGPSGNDEMKGYEVESKFGKGMLSKATETMAVKQNEL